MGEASNRAAARAVATKLPCLAAKKQIATNNQQLQTKINETHRSVNDQMQKIAPGTTAKDVPAVRDRIAEARELLAKRREQEAAQSRKRLNVMGVPPSADL